MSGFSPEADSSLFGFWQRRLPVAPREVNTNASLRIIRQVTSRFSDSARPKRTRAVSRKIFHAVKIASQESVTSYGEPDIPQNLLDANSIVSFHCFLFRTVKVRHYLVSCLPKYRCADYESDHSWHRCDGSTDQRKRERCGATQWLCLFVA